jgi:hypothetical protein
MMIETYRELRDILNKMEDGQLNQQIQVMLPQFDRDKPFPLHPVISAGTVKYFVSSEDGVQQDETRSSVDNKHNPEEFILLVDWNPYDEDGIIAYDLGTGEPIEP